MNEIENGAGTLLVTLTSQKSKEQITLKSTIPIQPASIRLYLGQALYHVQLTSAKVEELVTVELLTDVSQRRHNVNLLFKQCPEFYSTITSNGNGWEASFNGRQLSISKAGSGLYVVDLETGDTIKGDELHSVTNFLKWHVNSQRYTSKVPRLWTTR